MNKKIYRPLFCAAIACTLAACDQKELCMNHWNHAPALDFRLNVEWQLDWQYTPEGGTDWAASWDAAAFGIAYDDLRPSKPEGVRVLDYGDDGDVSTMYVDADGGKIFLAEGPNELLMVNSDTEYIIFNDLYTCASAKATTRSCSRASFMPSNSPVDVPGAENTVSPPDALFGHYIERYDAERRQETQTLNVTMKPLTFTYLVRYTFSHGLEYVGLARGALSGVAASVYLTDGHTGADVVTVLYDCDIREDCIEARVNSFGAPDYPNGNYSRSERPYALNLEVRLKNGRLLTFNFDISEQMRLQPQGGVIEVDGIVIPDSEGLAAGSGFDIAVEGWGNAIDVPLF